MHILPFSLRVLLETKYDVMANESISKEEEQYTPVVQILSSLFVWPGQGHCHLAYSLYTVKDAKAATATIAVPTTFGLNISQFCSAPFACRNMCFGIDEYFNLS